MLRSNRTVRIDGASSIKKLKKKKSNKNISPAREMGIALPRLKEKEYEQYFCMSNHVCDKSVLPVFAVFDVRAE